MSNELDKLEAALHEGMRLSGRPSMGRRAPASAAVPHLTKARSGLRQFVNAHPDDARAHRLLSLVEETMLGYGAAIAALERAAEISGGGDKRDLKRLAMLRQAAAEWSQMPLKPDELRELGTFLKGKLDAGETDRSLRWTTTWLRDRDFGDEAQTRVLAALADRGAFSDMQVYHNVARG